MNTLFQIIQVLNFYVLQLNQWRTQGTQTLLAALQSVAFIAIMRRQPGQPIHRPAERRIYLLNLETYGYP
jgi:hypothetical protein